MSTYNISNTIILFLSTIIAGILNYVYHPIMLRYMGIVEFGEFASLVSIINIIGVLVLGINVYLTREYSKDTKNLSKIKSMSSQALILLALLGVVFVGIFFIFVPLLTRFLHFESASGFYSIGILILISFLGIGYNPVFRALKMFKYLAFFQVLNPLLKLLFGVSLVMYGFGLLGALGGFIISSIVTLIFAYFFLYLRLKDVNSEGSMAKFLEGIYHQKNDLFGFIVSSILFSIIMNFDILIAKSMFEPSIAGIYAGIAIISKFLVYLLLSIETVYYGQIMELPKKSVPHRYYFEPIILMLAITILSILGCNWFGDSITSFIHLEITGQKEALLLSIGLSGILAFLSFVSNILIGYKVPHVNQILFFGIIGILMLLFFVEVNSFVSLILCFLIPITSVCAFLSYLLIKMICKKEEIYPGP